MSGKVTHWTGCILGLIRYEATIGPEFVYCACIHCKHTAEHYVDRNGVWPPGALSSQALHAMRHKLSFARACRESPRGSPSFICFAEYKKSCCTGRKRRLHTSIPNANMCAMIGKTPRLRMLVSILVALQLQALLQAATTRGEFSPVSWSPNAWFYRLYSFFLPTPSLPLQT